MTVPTYDQFIEPILRFLAAHPDGARARDVHDAAADALQLSETDRAERLPSGMQAVYKNRSGWAHDRLKRAGLSECPRRGYWRITTKGIEFAQANSAPLSATSIEDLADSYRHIRLRPEVDSEEGSSNNTPEQSLLEPSSREVSVSPDERLELALNEIEESVATELLESIADSSPQFFEILVLDLLHSMGYGTSRDALKRVGGSGDSGIDGIISLDRLGLEKVYIQAKRWQNSVGRPEIQGFYGALAGQRATKGVFITTSMYTKQAVEFADSVERIVLVDGVQLAKYMIEYGIGVSHRAIKVPKLDSDYFED
ncbi:MAG: restriction endonuclease [Cyanobacteria bacterium]|nr:restriction endonuclease [Cyanobacteriota bacterium]MDA0867433.1 restriction endonuclease [Cyanobacteriota bacterium]